jgi:predicted transcriptional regulator
MTTVELKNSIIHRISELNDKSLLNAIKTLIETKSESTIYKTIPEQRKRIKEGRTQIAKGEFFSNEQVEMEIDKWFAEK